MITYFINKIISQKKEIKLLNNGLKSLLSRIRVLLKSFQSRIQNGSFISPYGDREKNYQSNQHRAPPFQLPPF